ncbi:MAG: hypothetical protein P1V97_19815 [Planctomycetota bacterium]|nr:hypothetical protein [Planctomycetota bacterium]
MASTEEHNNTEKRPQERRGSKILIAITLVVGLCVVSVSLVVFLEILNPSLLINRGNGNEAAAVGTLRTFCASELLYAERSGKGRYGTMNDLLAAKYLDETYKPGFKLGYRFQLKAYDDEAGQSQFWAKASPAIPGETGDRYFFVDSSGVIMSSDRDFRVNPRTGKPEAALVPLFRPK